MMKLPAIGLVAVLLCTGACARDAQPAAATTTPYAIVLPDGVQAPRRLPPKTKVVSTVAPRTTTSNRLLSRARKRLESAKALYLDLAFKESLKELDRAQKALERPPWTDESFKLLREVTLLRAQDALALGDEAMLSESLRQSILIDPRTKLDAAAFPPDFRETYEAARGSLRTEPAEAVSVTSSVPEAEVSINGRPAGLTPLTARLHTIRYYLELSAFGYQPATEIIDIDQRGTAPIHLELEPLDVPELAGTFAAMDAAAMLSLEDKQRLLLAQTNAPDPTIHVSKSQLGWTGLQIDPSSGAIAARALSDASDTGRALDKIVASLRTDGRERDSGDKPLVRKWWFWTAIIGGAAAAGLTTYFLVRKDPEPRLIFRNP